MSLRAPRSLVPVVAVLVLAAAALCLIAVGIYYCVKPMFLDTSRENVCVGAGRTTCYVDEPGVVVASANDVLTVRHPFGTETTLTPSVGWEGEPRPGAGVVLQHWEGAAEIAYVYDERTGRRHGTRDAPDRAEGVGGMFILLLVGAGICAKTYAWLRGY